MSVPTLDPRPILTMLGLPATARATAVTGGADAALWRVEDGGEAYALRLLRANQTVQGHNETVTMREAAQAGVPVPHIVATSVWDDRPALLMTWCPGQTMAAALLCDPAQVGSLGNSFGRAQAAIHAVSAPAGLATTTTTWLDWAAPDDALRDRLRRLAIGPVVLIHLDYHPLNVMVGEGEITAVIDWANARSGDRRADLARTAVILRFLPLERQMPTAAASAFRRALTESWWSGYFSMAPPVRNMAPFYAWAGQGMIHDLSPRLGRPDLPWLTTAYLDRIRAWAASWRRRAGLPEMT